MDIRNFHHHRQPPRWKARESAMERDVQGLGMHWIEMMWGIGMEPEAGLHRSSLSFFEMHCFVLEIFFGTPLTESKAEIQA
jgi:hypothetical protein